MLMWSSLKGQPARQERIPAVDQDLSGIPMAVEIRSPQHIAEPVNLARALKLFGLSLSEAHGVLNQLKEYRTARLTITVSESSGSPSSLERFGVTVTRRRD